MVLQHLGTSNRGMSIRGSNVSGNALAAGRLIGLQRGVMPEQGEPPRGGRTRKLARDGGGQIPAADRHTGAATFLPSGVPR